MKENSKTAFWIVIVFGILALLRFFGMASSYSSNETIRNIGGYAWVYSGFYGFSIYLLLPIFFVIIYSIIKKFPKEVYLIPILYLIQPLFDLLSTVISYDLFGVPIYNSAFAETFIFKVLVNNSFVMIVNLAIFVYSLFVLRKINK